MKISTKGRYAVRLLLDIAMNDEVEPVRLKDVLIDYYVGSNARHACQQCARCDL